LRSVGRRISSERALARRASVNQAMSKSSKLLMLSELCACIPSKIATPPVADRICSFCTSKSRDRPNPAILVSISRLADMASDFWYSRRQMTLAPVAIRATAWPAKKCDLAEPRPPCRPL